MKCALLYNMANNHPRMREASDYVSQRIAAIRAGTERPNEFYESLFEAWTRYRSFTDNQVEAVLRSIDRFNDEQNERAKLNDVPTGKRSVRGRVISARSKETQFGEKLGIVVHTDDNYKVYGNCPKQLIEPIENLALDILTGRGPIVSFDATIKPSDRDPKFGFFKYPSRPKLVSQHSH